MNSSKFHIEFRNTEIIDLIQLADRNKPNEQKDKNDFLNDYNPFFIEKLQKYNPIYSLFPEHSQVDVDHMSLNQKYEVIDEIGVIDYSESKSRIEKSIFIKYSPLLDPVRYMIGKYDIHDDKIRCLPSFIKTKTESDLKPAFKLENVHNASYVDSFFCYLSSQLYNCHKVINSIDYYGSYLGIQKKFKMNITDDYDYLKESSFFLYNINNFFAITEDKSLFANYGSRNNKQKIVIHNKSNKTDSMPIDLEIEDLSFQENQDVQPSDFVSKAHGGGEEEVVYEKQKETSKSVSDSSNDTMNNSETNYSTDSDTDPGSETSHFEDEADEESDYETIYSSQEGDVNNVIEEIIEVIDDKTENDKYEEDEEDKDEKEDEEDKDDEDEEDDEDDEEEEDEDEDEDEEDDEDDEEEDEDDDEEEEDDDEDEKQIYAYINQFPVQMICLEKCDGTFDELLMAGLLNESEAASALFQIVMTLLIYQKAFHFTHNDLHTNNIMYIHTDLQYIVYIHKNKTYKVPTYGKIYKIIDFGRSIYKFNGQTFCSDSFAAEGDAVTQYNCEPFFNSNKPRLDPNFSFDLCRLGCSIYGFVIDDEENYDDFDEFQKIIYRWCLDDNHKNILYKKNGEERYPNFKLYKMIARTVHKHTPEEQLKYSFFNQFEVSDKNKEKEDMSCMMEVNIDAIPCYSYVESK